jgi:hypothetical protein
MPSFCGAKRMINCIINSGEEAGGIEFKRRRMGIDSSGSTVSYDIFGEPVSGITDVYNDLLVNGMLSKKRSINDEKSNIGGFTDTSVKKSIDIMVSRSADVLKNDLVEYPVDSNDWYRVCEIETIAGSLKNIYGISEVRSTI